MVDHSRDGRAAVAEARVVGVELIPIICADGWRVAASLIRPATPVRAVLVVNSAMGVPHRIYLAFARFLARDGIATLLYDYRGIAGSAPASLRGCTADLLDWARLDFPAAVAAARREYPDRPLVLLGHSIGGQLFGLDRVSLDARALIGVAAQSGYWGHWQGIGRLGLWALWYIGIPLLSPSFGYFPARVFGVGENLPSNVALQWASWGRHPLYLLNPESGVNVKDRFFDAIEAPLLSIGIAGDGFAPQRAVEAYQSWFVCSRITAVTVPREERLGHFGWFREGQGEKHWRGMLDWLDSTLAGRAHDR